MTVKTIRDIYLESDGRRDGDPEYPADFEPAWMEENSAYFRNHRVNSAMDGLLVAGPSEISDEIIDLLKSDHEISREVRDALAEAFLRGRGGNRPRIDDPSDVRPYITVAGGGDRAKLSKAVLIRRKWFDAGEQVERLSREGRKGSAVMLEVGTPLGLDYDSMKKAKAFYKKFLVEFEDENSDLNKLIDEKAPDLRKTHVEFQLHEDLKDIARSYFIEREAAALTGVSFAEFGG